MVNVRKFHEKLWNLSCDPNCSPKPNKITAKTEVNWKFSGKKISVEISIKFKIINKSNDCNRTRNQNHLYRKRTLTHLAKLAKWLSCVLSTYLYGAFDCIFLSRQVCFCHDRFGAWFEQGVPWHSGNYRVWIHSETRTRHGKNIQSNAPCRCVHRTQLNHLLSLAKWFSVCSPTRWFWIRVQLQSLKVQISCLLRERSSLTFSQL